MFLHDLFIYLFVYLFIFLSFDPGPNTNNVTWNLYILGQNRCERAGVISTPGCACDINHDYTSLAVSVVYFFPLFIRAVVASKRCCVIILDFEIDNYNRMRRPGGAGPS